MGRKLKNDYTGKKCGCWEVIERDMNPKSKSHETFWKSRCSICGNEASVRKTDLDKEPRSCNNCKGAVILETLRNNDSSVWKIGDKYGMLTIIGKGDSRKELKGHQTFVKVQCSCGSEPFNVRLKHLKGQGKGRTISCGCAKESAGELKIRSILEEYDINFQKQYRVKNEQNEVMIFDFVIFNDKNEIIKCIEYNGLQHYQPVEYFGGEEAFEQQQMRDARKTEYCNAHAIILQWVPYYDYDSINPEYLKLK